MCYIYVIMCQVLPAHFELGLPEVAWCNTFNQFLGMNSLTAEDLDKCGDEGCLIKPVAIWCGINLGISLLAAALVTYVQVGIKT